MGNITKAVFRIQGTSNAFSGSASGDGKPQPEVRDQTLTWSPPLQVLSPMVLCLGWYQVSKQTNHLTVMNQPSIDTFIDNGQPASVMPLSSCVPWQMLAVHHCIPIMVNESSTPHCVLPDPAPQINSWGGMAKVTSHCFCEDSGGDASVWLQIVMPLYGPFCK